MTINLRIQSLALIACLAFLASLVDGQESLAIRGGRVLTMAGEPLNDVVILVRDGTIQAIGPDLEIPVDATIIDAQGKVIMPGFVEAHSSAAMSQANETNPIVPYVSVVDSIDPTRLYFDEARRNGVTTVAVVPGNSTMIGGQAAVLKTGGMFVDSMLLVKQSGMKLSLQPQGNSSRMGHLSALRAELDKAKNPSAEESTEAQPTDETQDEEQSGESQDDAEEPAGEETPPTTSTAGELRVAMTKLVNGEIKAYLYCETPTDVQQAIRLVEDYELQPILVLGRDSYRAADAVAASGYPAILDPSLVFWETDPRTDETTKIVLPRIFQQAGVEFVFQVDDPSGSSTIGSNYLWYQAAQAVKYGMSEEQALRSLTSLPAEILGVQQFVGSIEVGKDADLIILSGEPLRMGTWVEKTIVNGEVVYDRNEDYKLERLLNGADNANDPSSQR